MKTGAQAGASWNSAGTGDMEHKGNVLLFKARTEGDPMVAFKDIPERNKSAIEDGAFFATQAMNALVENGVFLANDELFAAFVMAGLYLERSASGKDIDPDETLLEDVFYDVCDKIDYASMDGDFLSENSLETLEESLARMENGASRRPTDMDANGVAVATAACSLMECARRHAAGMSSGGEIEHEALVVLAAGAVLIRLMDVGVLKSGQRALDSEEIQKETMRTLVLIRKALPRMALAIERAFI